MEADLSQYEAVYMAARPSLITALRAATGPKLLRLRLVLCYPAPGGLSGVGLDTTWSFACLAQKGL